MLKGARKAIVRTPHRLIGSKSIEDRIIIEWSKDFDTAENAVDFLMKEVSKLSTYWTAICKCQVALAKELQVIYEPISGDNAYSVVQETPESSMVAIQGYVATVQEVETKILPLLAEFEVSFVAKCKTVKEIISNVHKALKKREHKKLDFDRHSNNVEKLLKKQDLSEKDQQQLVKMEQELDAATDIFHAQDEKVKSTIPYLLTTMSEFLNPLTSQLYLTQLNVYKIWSETLFAYSQTQGLAGTLLSVSALGKPFPPPLEVASANGATDLYETIAETWETQFMTLQPRCEQGLETLRKGKAITKVMRSEPEEENKKAHKPTSFRFTSPQGLFWKEADLLAISPSLSRGSAPSSPSTGSRSTSMSQRTMLNLPSGLSASSFHTPVTVADAPSPETDQLRTRVRASLSTAARALSMPSDLSEDIATPTAATSPEKDDVPISLTAAAAAQHQQPEPILRGRSNSRAISVRSSISVAAPPAPPKSKGERTGAIPATSANEQAVALYTFPGAEPGDVAFRRGDAVHVLDHGTATDDQWWFGQTADGRLGLFPRSYVALS